MDTPSVVRVNLGAGLQAYEHPGYIAVDVIQSEGIDIVWDCNRGLPSEVAGENSVDEFLCKHFLEHLTHEGFFRLMDAMWVALKPGGVLRVFVPNGEHVIAAHSDPTHRLVFTRGTMDYFTKEVLAAYPYTDRPWKILKFSVNGTPPDDLWELAWEMTPDKRMNHVPLV